MQINVERAFVNKDIGLEMHGSSTVGLGICVFKGSRETRLLNYTTLTVQITSETSVGDTTQS